MHDDGLRTLLTTLDPKARDDLRRVLIHDQADRDRDEAARPEAEAISGPDLQAVWVAVLRGLDDRRASPVRGALSRHDDADAARKVSKPADLAAKSAASEPLRVL